MVDKNYYYDPKTISIEKLHEEIATFLIKNKNSNATIHYHKYNKYDTTGKDCNDRCEVHHN